MKINFNDYVNPIDFQYIADAIIAMENEVDWQFWLNCYPALNKAKSTPQDLIYHAEGDVWKHTQMVAEALIVEADYQLLNDQDKIVVFLAALLHDIAKADTTVIDPITQRISHPHHASRGAIDSRVYLWFQHTPFEIREKICGLILHHQKPYHLFKKENMTLALHTMSWEVPLNLLFLLARADIIGRICNDKVDKLADISLLETIAMEEACLFNEKSYCDTITRTEYARHHRGTIDYPFYKSLGSEVLVLSGLPASGKNHYIKTHLPNWPVVSFDDTRERLGLRYGENHGLISHSVIEEAKNFLRTKQPFVWNATNITRSLRDKTLDLLYQYNANVKIVYIEKSPEVIFKQNAKREDSIPVSAIEKMLKRWEIPKTWESYEVKYLVVNN